LLVRILTHPPDWDIRLAQLQKESDIGRDKCRKLIKNIMEAGYMRRAKTRDHAGQWVYIYTVYDVPQAPEPEIIIVKNTTPKESIDEYLTLGAKYGGKGGAPVRDPGAWMSGVAARIAQQGGLKDADRAQLSRWRRRAADDKKSDKKREDARAEERERKAEIEAAVQKYDALTDAERRKIDAKIKTKYGSRTRRGSPAWPSALATIMSKNQQKEAR
jgi:hypothetical protein